MSIFKVVVDKCINLYDIIHVYLVEYMKYEVYFGWKGGGELYKILYPRQHIFFTNLFQNISNKLHNISLKNKTFRCY